VLTDGGGVIQETTYLNIPTVAWRIENDIDIQFKNNKNILISNYDIAKVKNFLKSLEVKNRIFNNSFDSPSEKISLEIEKRITKSII
jgi:UDP-N-acetylglucosamine 2-epimerase